MSQENTNEFHEGEGVQYSFGDDCRRTTTSDEAFNSQFDRESIILRPGDVCCLDDKNKMLVSAVGSGVCLTIFDQKLYFGVMAHLLMTPEMCNAFPKLGDLDENEIAKIVEPIEMAIAEMKKRGAGKNRIRIRLFGGANLSSDDDAGTKNYVFVKDYLKRKGLQVMGEDIGGAHIRRVHFLPDVGSVTRFSLKRDEDVKALNQDQTEYFKRH